MFSSSGLCVIINMNAYSNIELANIFLMHGEAGQNVRKYVCLIYFSFYNISVIHFCLPTNLTSLISYLFVCLTNILLCDVNFKGTQNVLFFITTRIFQIFSKKNLFNTQMSFKF